MARELLARVNAQVVETRDARKVRFDRPTAIALARKAKVVIASRGNTVVRFDMRKSPPDDDTLAKSIVGPTGNLKAPTLRLRDRLIVGFCAAAYEELR